MNNELINMELSEEILVKIDEKTKKYIDQACLYEKQNERDSALRLFQRVIFLENTSNDLELLYYLHMKIANIYDTNGDKELGLKHYNYAYEQSLILDNKEMQVDALINIIEINYFIGEMESAINRAYKVDDILKEIDYTKGKLEISMFWLKVYYIKNEYYKARDIGNKALKLCGEGDAYYRGRILNVLAKLYAEIVSVDEHLKLLNQALDCFEECGFIRGKLGVLNNIGTVYSEKLEQYDEALKYFIKVKELSEERELSELEIMAHSNIADIQLRKGKYIEAYTSSKHALELAKEINMQDMIFYDYSFLIDASMKMYKFNQAYGYYKLAKNEYKNRPNQGRYFMWYLKITANFFLEIGDINRAEKIMNEAIVVLDEEESIVKWEIGVLYEQIKLIKANNQMELDEVLNRIQFILSKYQDSQTMLSKVYEIAILLFMRGHEKETIRFSSKYFNIEVKNENTELKMKYIKIVFGEKDNDSKITMLKRILKEAIEVNEIRIIFLVLYSLGDLYTETGNYNEAIENYYMYCEEVKKVMDLVPVEFKGDYFIYKNYYYESNRALIIENKINSLYSICEISEEFKNKEKLESINKFICTMKKFTEENNWEK